MLRGLVNRRVRGWLSRSTLQDQSNILQSVNTAGSVNHFVKRGRYAQVYDVNGRLPFDLTPHNTSTDAPQLTDLYHTPKVLI